MQLVFGLVVLTLAALFQATVISRLPILLRVDLVLVFVLAWSLIRGVSEGTVGGITGGLALDLVSGTPFGLHTGLLGMVGSLTALGEANLFRGNMPIFALTTALATVLFHAGSLLVLQAAGLQTPGLFGFVHYAVPVAMLNAALMPLVFTAVHRGVRALGGWRQLEL